MSETPKENAITQDVVSPSDEHHSEEESLSKTSSSHSSDDSINELTDTRLPRVRLPEDNVYQNHRRERREYALRQRDAWSSGLFDWMCDACSCFSVLCCPCIVYAFTNSALDVNCTDVFLLFHCLLFFLEYGSRCFDFRCFISVGLHPSDDSKEKNPEKVWYCGK